MQIFIRKSLTPKETEQIIDLHTRILDESVLNKFGKNFLRIMYTKILKNKKNIVITLDIHNNICGFLVATVDGTNFFKDIKSNCFKELSIEILKKTYLNPKLFLETLIWSFLKSQKNEYPASLQFIAVDSFLQGKGYGTKMVSALHKEFLKRKISQYKVGTKAANIKSNGFYKKLNFKLLYQDTILGVANNYYLSPVIGQVHPKSKGQR